MLPKPTGVEYRKMISGEYYRPADPELTAYHQQAREVLHRFNTLGPTQAAERRAILRELFGSVGADAWVEQRLHVDYGCNIHVGDRFYANANCVLLDVAEIRIGNDAMLAPAVGLYTATHPVDAATRVSGVELGFPITIGSRVWLGGGVIVCPGVTIGDDVVVGAGAVVTTDLPDRVLAVGNPARVVREL